MRPDGGVNISIAVMGSDKGSPIGVRTASTSPGDAIVTKRYVDVTREAVRVGCGGDDAVGDDEEEGTWD